MTNAPRPYQSVLLENSNHFDNILIDLPETYKKIW